MPHNEPFEPSVWEIDSHNALPVAVIVTLFSRYILLIIE